MFNCTQFCVILIISNDISNLTINDLVKPAISIFLPVKLGILYEQYTS